MTEQIRVTLLQPEDDLWAAEIDRLNRLLGAPHNPLLFPPHFLKVTFPRIGGKLIEFGQGADLHGAGLLFPRGPRDGAREFTLRYHPIVPDRRIDERELARQVESILPGDKVVFYDPQRPQHYAPQMLETTAAVALGVPGLEEALAVRRLQKEVWHCEDEALYPADIHSADFRAGTSLVATQDHQPVGFLFGFYKFGDTRLPRAWEEKHRGEFRVESQLMGVLPQYQSLGLGYLFKRLQARQAQRDGVGVVNWTVDPLQYPNAVLNFGKLKAIAFDFYPDYYPFRNAFNQVAAARFAITWLVNTERVKRALAHPGKATVMDLGNNPAAERVNDGAAGYHLDATGPVIAVEVPGNWTELQWQDRELALRWREVSGQLFRHYLGPAEGKYMITGVGRDEARKFLIAERVTPELLDRYGKGGQ